MERLFADRPEYEGKRLIDLKSHDGKYVIRDMIDLVSRHKRGFYEYEWSKPGAQGDAHRKIACVELFEPLGWVIGTGNTWRTCSSKCNRGPGLAGQHPLRHGRLSFRSYANGDPLFTNGVITKGTGNISDLTDPDGVKIFQDQKKAAQSPEGGFVHYRWKKLDSETPTPKIAFVMSYPPWHWIIGSGVYLDEIAAAQAELRNKLTRDMIRGGVGLSIVFVCVCGITILIASRLSERLKKETTVLTDFFAASAQGTVHLDPGAFSFVEYATLAASAAAMGRMPGPDGGGPEGYGKPLPPLVPEPELGLRPARGDCGRDGRSGRLPVPGGQRGLWAHPGPARRGCCRKAGVGIFSGFRTEVDRNLRQGGPGQKGPAF